MIQYYICEEEMYYTLYEIDDKNKIIYLEEIENIYNKEMLLNIKNDYQKIIEYANKNNYLIKLHELNDNYEDIFSFKKSL